MSDTLGFPHDHEEVAWSHFLAQHEYKPYTEAFVKAFYAPLNELDTAQNELYTLRWLETATGVQLDGIGSIVGQSREVPKSVYLPFFGFITQPSGRAFGVARMRFDSDPYAESAYLGDEEYRYSIITKIALNNSHGTAEDIMNVMNRTLNVTGTIVSDAGNANIGVYIDNMLINAESYEASILDAIIPRAGGVGFSPYVFDRDNTFGFSNQLIYFGFGVGILARQIVSNLPPISIASSPAINLDFMTPGAMPSLITFSRATVGKYFDSSGLMQTAAINAPRWDYNPITHALNGLLLEDTRININPHGLPHTSNGWAVSSAATAASAGIAPDGANAMVKLTDSVTTNTFHIVNRIVTITAGQQYAVSVYAKAVEYRYLQIVMDDNSAAGSFVTFDLITGTITGPALAQNGATLTGGYIQDVGNGIYRCILVSNAGPSSTNLRVAFVLAVVSNPGKFAGYTGVVGNGLLLWGAQFELGDYVTSYIATAGTTVTRQTDICEISAANVNTFYNGVGGSWVAEFGLFDPTPPNTRILCRPVAAGNPGVLNVGVTRLLGQYDGAGVNAVGAIPINTFAKGASTWTPGQAKICVNGGAVTVASNLIGGYSVYATYGIRFISNSGDTGSGHLRNVRYWKEILTNSDMQSLTA